MAKYNRLGKIDRMYDSTLWVLGREIAALRNKSIGGALSAGEGKSLREYIKTIKELKAAHEEIEAKKAAKAESEAKGLSTEALEAKVKS